MDQAITYEFGPDYLEEVALGDGAKVVLRTLRMSDKALLERGFARLSPESRYLRFFSSKTALSEKELKYLSEIDGVDHFAVGAGRILEDGSVEGLGVARFVRFDPGGEVAEPAVAVIDDWQGRGLGTLLLDRLAAAARERGIKRFSFEFMSDNAPMRHLVRELTLGRDAKLVEEDGIVYAEIEVPEAPAPEASSDVGGKPDLHRFLAHHASGKIAVRIRRSLLKYQD